MAADNGLPSALAAMQDIYPRLDVLQERSAPTGPSRGLVVNNEAIINGVPYISARNLTLKTVRGYVYDDVNVDVYPSEIVAVRGRNGSGKSSLLLTLAGRMKQSSGTLRVGDYELPKHRSKVQRLVGLGVFKGLNDLQNGLSVAAVTEEEFDAYGLKARKDIIRDYLIAWGLLDVAKQRVGNLTSERRTQLEIALSFVTSPKAVVIDDIEDQLTMSQSVWLMKLLVDAARSYHCSIVVGITERELASMVDACVYLSKEGD
ncbi:MAG: ATP-binding cassette domain-containing protein [Eggerthellaceae bacterium]|nr:ATP-binding cassette domain-containing protein [Eggerthellaceae bacterium]